MAAEELERWFREQPGSYLHPHVHISQDDRRGLHWRSEQAIDGGTKILVAPHSTALSYLNALVDERYTVFKDRRSDFTVEAIGFFYLMLEYVNIATSFWKPYLNSLPAPDTEHSTALWFDDPDDALWLRATDVEHTMDQRCLVYRSYYESGIKNLTDADVDVSQLSWNLFRWAITMFTSRSFPSCSIAPHEGKYWTTYKSGQKGNRQAVILDMRHVAANDLEFSVLFPVMDAGNHDPHAQVLWNFDPGRFGLTAVQPMNAEAEFRNNYGPKANDELLQGYGFCIQDNPNDVVLLTLKAPSQELQSALRKSHAGYFDLHGAWQSAKATFKLGRLPQSSGERNVIEQLPEALRDLMLRIIIFDCGIDSMTMDKTSSTVTAISEQQSRWFRPHLARMVLSSMAAKLQKLNATVPAYDAARAKHAYGKIYRQGQIDIMTSYADALRAYLTGFVVEDVSAFSDAGHLMTLEIALQGLHATSSRAVSDFMHGIAASANTSDPQALISAGWEEDMWVLLLTYTWLMSHDEQRSPVFPWTKTVLLHWIDLDSPLTEDGLIEQATGMLDIVESAARVKTDSPWTDPRWSAKMIATIGGRLFRDMSFDLPMIDDNGESTMRVLLHL